MQIRSSKDIAALVKDRRKAQRLNQSQLAQRAGVSRDWIIQLEKGKSSVELGMVLRTLNELGVRLELATGAAAVQTDRDADMARARSSPMPIDDLARITDSYGSGTSRVAEDSLPIPVIDLNRLIDGP